LTLLVVVTTMLRYTAQPVTQLDRSMRALCQLTCSKLLRDYRPDYILRTFGSIQSRDHLIDAIILRFNDNRTPLLTKTHEQTYKLHIIT